MGNCTFTIHTVGCHGNVRADGSHLKDDAEVLIEKMVEMLQAAGHSVTAAKLTYGGEYVVGISKKAVAEQPAPTPQSAPTPPVAAPGPVETPAPVPPAVIVPEPPPAAAPTQAPAPVTAPADAPAAPVAPAVDPNTPAAG